MPTAERREAERLFALMQEAGALPIEADTLLPSETLLDLYGEDLRARAYVTADPERGELMLRPDFTVPVVQRHMAQGAEPARYTYCGTVYRKQDPGSDRPNEFIQVGFEVFDRQAPVQAEAQVFALVQRALAGLDLRAATGDIGILLAAIQGLQTSDRRKAALNRHVWRPRRFRALLERYRGRGPDAPHRAALAALDPAAVPRAIADAGQAIGLRDAEDVAERIAALAEEAATPPISDLQAGVLQDILSLRGPSPRALERLRDITVDMPALEPAVARFADRLDALAAEGIDTDTLEFEASFGRTAMEYYDGFVFGFHAPARPDLQPVASGGRYDALTRVLGQGRTIPAVGAVIRPGLVAALRGEEG